MSKAAKRDRQRQNRENARARELALAKRRQRTKAARNVIIAAVVVVGVALLINVLQGGGKSKKKAKAKSTPTTAVTTPTTSAAKGAAVTCQNVSKPAPKTTSFKSAPPMTIDAKKTYTAVMDTSCGKITIALDAKTAPIATNNFVFLARQHFYDDEYFHRIVANFVIQDGDPKGDGSGGPGYSVKGEAPKDGYPVGALAAAKGTNEAAGTMGSQYFIVTSAQAGLTNDYARFGQVTAGMDVVNKIGTFAPANDTTGAGTPTKVVTIKSITITES